MEAWNHFIQTGKIDDYLLYCHVKDKVEKSYDNQDQSHCTETSFSLRGRQDVVSAFKGLRPD